MFELLNQAQDEDRMNDNKVYIGTDEALMIASQIKELRDMQKAMLKQEKRLIEDLELLMGDAEILSTIDGEQILKWAYSGPSIKFDMSAFKERLPEIHKQFLYEDKPVRRMTFVKK